ncbi:MAG: PhzF family phenazine biosynthesis protein [Longimicrobiales bacterium]
MNDRDLPSALRRLAAFTDDPRGGNRAGVWIGDTLPPPDEMQRIATVVGYSETAFLAHTGGPRYRTRYFSPAAEVSFCGHATIAAGVVLGELHGPGAYVLSTVPGDVGVQVSSRDGLMAASLTSVEPRYREPEPDLLAAILEALGWDPALLDPALPPALAYAGAWHVVLAVRALDTLQSMTYDFAALRSIMESADLTTAQLVWRESEGVFHSRNPFPVGGVVEDPATGAAAAALGGYLRDAGRVAAPTRFLIRQGEAMGRPSRIEVEVPASGGIVVTGTAVSVEPP